MSIATGNEQLVIEIKAGNSALLLHLWEQVKPYIRKQARRWISAFDGLHGVEPDDLINAGYFAMLQAVGAFDAERSGASFIGLLSFYLKKQFAAAYGMHTAAGRNDAIHIAVSLDAPTAEDEDTPLAELIPDVKSSAPFEQIAQRDYITNLRKALDTILAELPAACREIIVLRYYGDQDISTVAAIVGITEQAARAAENKAMRLMRTPSNLALLSAIKE